MTDLKRPIMCRREYPNGRTCARPVMKGGEYCWSHKGEEAEAALELANATVKMLIEERDRLRALVERSH